MGEVIQIEFGGQATPQLALAAGAEQLAYIDYRPESSIGMATVLPLFPERPLAETPAFSTEAHPYLADVRDQARAQAESLIEQRREQLFAGEFAAVPLEINVLGTVAKLDAVRQAFGEHSEEYNTVRSGALLDWQRKVAEAEQANDVEYFEPTAQVLDPETDMLFANGLSVDEMFSNGITPLGEAEEQDRRVNDFVIQAEKKAMLKSPELSGNASVHISTCAQWAIDAYRADQKKAHGNYVPAVEKLMVEYDWFDHDAGETYHEQVAMPGTLVTDTVVANVYADIGFLEAGPADKSTIHKTHGVVERTHIQDVFDVTALLDEEASRQTGKLVFMGKEVDKYHPRDYQAFRDEARQRRRSQAETAEQMLCYAEELHRNETDASLANMLVEQKLKDLLLAKAETDHELAARAFDAATARGFAHAQDLKAAGRHMEAVQILEHTRMQAPAVASCGAGECGLKALNPSDALDNEAKTKLQLKSGESVVKDTERSCVRCGEKSIYYAWTSSSVKKLCMNDSCGYSNFAVREPAEPKTPKRFSIFSNKDKQAYALVA